LISVISYKIFLHPGGTLGFASQVKKSSLGVIKKGFGFFNGRGAPILFRGRTLLRRDTLRKEQSCAHTSKHQMLADRGNFHA
jgi:hypothetical protein